MHGISVIIPTYNRESFIDDAIMSVLQQDFTGKIELIISDDGSTDRTLEKAYAYKDKLIIIRKPLDHKKHGASGARNRGIIASTQPYICFLDSDDLFLPGHLTKMYNVITSYPEAGFAFCKSLETESRVTPTTYRCWTKHPITSKDIKNLTVSNIYVANTNVFIFKSDVFEKVGLFDEEIKVGEDTDMWMRISEVFSGVFSDHFGAVVRVHSMDQLTDTPKNSLLKKHVEVFINGIKRQRKLKVKNNYRLIKLYMLIIKYSLSQYPVFNTIYGYLNKHNQKKRRIAREWHPLSYFIK